MMFGNWISVISCPLIFVVEVTDGDTSKWWATCVEWSVANSHRITQQDALLQLENFEH